MNDCFFFIKIAADGKNLMGKGFDQFIQYVDCMVSLHNSERWTLSRWTWNSQSGQHYMTS